MQTRCFVVTLALTGVFQLYSPHADAQTILTPWGNLAGMRVSGAPVEFEAGLRMVHPEWVGFSSAVKYLQRPRYSRTGARAVVESEIEGMMFRQVLEDTTPGEATLELQVTSKTNLSLAGAYFCVELPDTEFGEGTLALVQTGTAGPTSLTLSRAPQGNGPELLRQTATGMKIVGPQKNLEIRWNEPRTVRVRREASNRPTALNDPSIRQQFLANGPAGQPTGCQVYLELFAGDATPGRTAKASFRFAASASPDLQPVRLVLDVTKPGRPFEGIGGNFRLQFPKTDSAVLQYNLDHLRVAWGRLDMPWAEWDPEELSDPLVAARAGQVNQKVNDAMAMARTLARRRIPVILSAWSPPRWARALSQPPGLRGTALNPNKLDRICSSLASYLVFLKEQYGVEAVYFSFNEPETGVEVRQTPAEHVEFILRMGAELVQRGLTTKLLLGDTAHGTPAALDFIRPSLANPATHRYIGAVAFHTWRGCTAEALTGWAEAARELGVPLLITESGPDAHLHEYPSVRLEPWFQLEEIELYVRCCAYGQPATLMEWQLTTDYSVLTGGGVYGEAGPLKPTQRFWNLKQLGSTPAGAFALPITADRSEVTCAAFGDLANGAYAVHIVNRGAQRAAMLSGLPKSVPVLHRFVTDANRGMQKEGRIGVQTGKDEFILPAASYTTLLSPANTRNP
ncbi:MAG TPA: hypothetical protein PK256_09295 [Verrucomicrobiota bacterium]|nr:hypothetical protein [Verrucomicrobiota bacterium]